MNPALRFAYGAAGQLARALALVAPAHGAKVARSLAARRGILARYAAWAHARRDVTRPLLWIHAPSVGEGLQAKVVLELARTRRPDVQLAYTFFSPSAEAFARGLDADFADYLPFDTTGDVGAALDLLQPSALVFSKLDVWPVLCEQAARRGVRLGMISATMSPGSSRRGALATRLLQDAYSLLDRVAAVSEDDAARLAALGVREDRVVVAGDTRYDQVWSRAAAVNRTGPLLAPLVSPRPTLVAGSTWPADEEMIRDAWGAVRREVHGARLIIAPHEPTAEHVAALDAWGDEAALSHARLPGATAEHDMVIVDRVGVLGDLYALADAAFVGGGFHGAGLHSVLEPAAFGVPVIFGPQHHASRDAGLLMRAGGGDAVSTRDEMIEAMVRWLGDVESRTSAGEKARAFVRRGCGAGERAWQVVEELLRSRT